MKIRVGFRGWFAFFRKDWYGLSRFREMQINYNMRYASKIIDVGSFFVVFDCSKEFFKSKCR